MKLADAVFHESTMNALMYYSAKGYPQFEDSAIFIKIIRDWFNQMNVKGTDYGIRTRDEKRKPIRRETWHDDTSYLRMFRAWLEEWQMNFDPSKGLSVPTFKAAIRTTKGIVGLIEYLFERYPFLDFILLGNIQSDYLESRFGWWRQLNCGGNYYNSVIQFLQAEKTLRLRSLVSIGYNMSEIKSIYEISKVESSLQLQEEIRSFICDLELFEFDDLVELDAAESAVIYYIAGYIAKALLRGSCDECANLISPGKVPIEVHFDNLNNANKRIVEAKEEFISSISRGGLIKPSDYIYM